MTLTEKYKPRSFKEIKGQDIAIERIKSFLKRFPEKRALILQGPAGCGKTCLAYCLAYETNSEILEINASDLRNREQIANVIGQASKQSSLFNKNKILLIDEIDGITKDDYGGLSELTRLISTTNYPIIITANNIWDRKFSELRQKSEILQLKQLDYNIVFKILKDIAEKENLNLNEDILKSLAIKSKGDIRAAINDLQTISEETTHQDIHERDREENIFYILEKILKQLPNYETIKLYDKVNTPLDEIFLWLEENIPLEYKGEELYKAIRALSKADVFRGRIHRQQHWRFLVYQNFLLSFGVSSAKKQVKTSFTSYKKPSRILKIWIMNQKQKYKKSISQKYAKFTHTNIKRAEKDFPIIRQIMKSEPKTAEQLKLNEDEIKFLFG